MSAQPPVGRAEAVRQLLESIREKQPDATEREAWLLYRLIGAMGMVRSLMKHGSYTWDHDYDRDAFHIFNDWLQEQYGWTLTWPEKKK